jgi:dipeptidyl aminopeptidase/acylaminoacyl peptidase
MDLLAHPQWNLLQGRFSPDGRWIAFHTTTSHTLRQIYVAPSDPERVVPFDRWIPIVTDSGTFPSWSADGSALYHSSIRDGHSCVWIQRLEPATKRPIGTPEAVQHFHQPRLRHGQPASIPTVEITAGYLYVPIAEVTGNIWMLDETRR